MTGNNDYFKTLPKPDTATLPDYLKDIIILHGQARLVSAVPLKEILKHCLLRSDNSYTYLKMGNTIKKNPAYLAKKMENIKMNDFRDFIKDMVCGEQENIVDSLHNLRRDGYEKEYQQAIQGWAKFGFGTEQKVDISVDVTQKRDLIKAISDDYKYSEAIDAEYSMVSPAELEEEAASTKEELQDHLDENHTLTFQGDVDADAPDFNPYAADLNVKKRKNRRMWQDVEKEKAKAVSKLMDEQYGNTDPAENAM